MLVVFGHNWAVLHDKGELFRVVFSFHLPLFFFLSGVLLRESDSLKKLATLRMQSLLKPYFTTLLCLGLVALCVDAVKAKAFPSHYMAYFEGVLYATGRTIDWVPLWFLPHLFLASCATLLVIKLISSTWMRLVYLALSLAVGVLLLSPADRPWSLDLLPISSSFLLAGYLSKRLVQSMTFNSIFFILAAAIFTALHAFFDVTIDLNMRVYGDFLIATLQAFSGIYLCLSLSSLLAQHAGINKLMSYIGSGTLFILIFHYTLQWKVFGFISKFVAGSFVPAVGSFVAAVVLPLMLWECVKRSRLLSRLFFPQKMMPIHVRPATVNVAHNH